MSAYKLETERGGSIWVCNQGTDHRPITIDAGGGAEIHLTKDEANELIDLLMITVQE